MTEEAITPGPLVGTGRTAELYAWSEGKVLKLYRADMPEHWAYHEAWVARIVVDAGLSAPALGAPLGQPDQDVIRVDGRLGIVYQRLEGPSMLDQLGQQPGDAAQLARQFATLHLQMHAISHPQLPSQREALVQAVHYAPRLSDRVKERVLQRLTQLPDGQALCHGDFHPGNVLMTASGPVVIDWMTATAGHPLADVARTTLMFRTARVPSDYDASMRLVFQQVRDGFYATYLHCYREQRPFPLAEMEAWIPVLAAARLNEGIADEREALLRLVGEA